MFVRSFVCSTQTRPLGWEEKKETKNRFFVKSQVQFSVETYRREARFFLLLISVRIIRYRGTALAAQSFSSASPTHSHLHFIIIAQQNKFRLISFMSQMLLAERNCSRMRNFHKSENRERWTRPKSWARMQRIPERFPCESRWQIVAKQSPWTAPDDVSRPLTFQRAFSLSLLLRLLFFCWCAI